MALSKLAYCDRIVSRVRDTAPLVTDDERDEDVADIAYTLEAFYEAEPDLRNELPPGIDGALRAIFRELIRRDGGAVPELAPAAGLFRRLERDLMASVFRWTGHFPERTRLLVRHLADRATTLELGYDAARAEQAQVAVTTFVTALAMNFIHRGSYLP